MQTHRIDYHIHSHFDPARSVDVHATPEEIAAFAEQGFLIRERLLDESHTGRLKAALDSLAAEESESAELSRARSFGGLFLRHLMEKRAEFLELFRFQPTLSIARAMLGPQVQVLPMTARISYPDEPNQETEWHFHQRVLPEPMPPFFCQPHVIDCLIYLDDLNEANGALKVVPGSHRRIHADIPAESKWGHLPGEATLRLPAGSCVLLHGGLWHRALPTTPAGTVRRLLILPYAAAWLKLPSYGTRPENGLMRHLYTNPDQETRELLGIAEGLY